MTAQRPFKPIERTSVSERIRQELLSRIDNGELAPGSPLPSERTLTEQFKVARTSVREAIQGLISLGFIERRGNRSYVTEYLPEISVTSKDDREEFVRYLFETHRVLELPIFELSTFRATDDDRRRIQALADQFHDDMDIVEFRQLDRRFHARIASACGNPLLKELYGKVLDALFRSDALGSLPFDDANEESAARIIAQSGEEHRAIARAVLARDPVAVLEAAKGHEGAERQIVDNLV